MKKDCFSVLWEDAHAKTKARKWMNSCEVALFENKFSMSLDELENISKEIGPEFASIWTIFYLNALSKTAEITLNIITKFLRSFKSLIAKFPDLKSSIFEMYFSTFLHWVCLGKTCKEIVKALSRFQTEIGEEEEYLFIVRHAQGKFYEFIWEIVAKVYANEEVTLMNLGKILKMLKKADRVGLDVALVSEIICSQALEYLEDIIDLHGIKNPTKVLRNVNIDSGKVLVSYLKGFYQFPEICKRTKIVIEKIGEPSDKEMVNKTLLCLDFGQLTFDQLIFQEENEEILLKVYKTKSADGDNIIIKQYYAKNDSNDLDFISKEIKNLKILSDRASQNNCFLNFFGSTQEPNQLSLYLEYAEFNLTQVLLNNSLPSQKIIIDQIHRLIFSFSELESLQLSHYVISAENILFTEDFEIKLINVGISEDYYREKSEKLWINKINLKNSCYSAPELVGIGEKVNYWRATIFSVGLVILQIVQKINLAGLNLEENYEDLRTEIAVIEINWVRDLLSKMLKIEKEGRLTFLLLLKFIPLNKTLFN